MPKRKNGVAGWIYRNASPFQHSVDIFQQYILIASHFTRQMSDPHHVDCARLKTGNHGNQRGRHQVPGCLALLNASTDEMYLNIVGGG